MARKLQGSRVCQDVKSSDRRIMAMPVCFIEAPPGIRAEAKKRMVEKITSAIGEASRLSSCANIQRKMSRRMAASNPKNPKILEALKKIGA